MNGEINPFELKHSPLLIDVRLLIRTRSLMFLSRYNLGGWLSHHGKYCLFVFTAMLIGVLQELDESRKIEDQMNNPLEVCINRGEIYRT